MIERERESRESALSKQLHDDDDDDGDDREKIIIQRIVLIIQMHSLYSFCCYKDLTEVFNNFLPAYNLIWVALLIVIIEVWKTKRFKIQSQKNQSKIKS